MRAIYPLHRGELDSLAGLAAYELGYLAFFVAIEFVFRGWLLFGLFSARGAVAPAAAGGEPGPLLFGYYYAILLSMLSYTAWHLGKPELELWGTLPWGLVTGAVVLATRSVWPVIIVHWLLNVLLDVAILEGW